MGRDGGSDSPHIFFGCDCRRLNLRLSAMPVGDEVVEHSEGVRDAAQLERCRRSLLHRACFSTSFCPA
jgi:hypothetical protein